MKRPVTPEDLFRLRFLMGADLTPDGSAVVYALSRTDVEANTDHTDLFVVDVASGRSRQLTTVDAVHASPVFAPDGRTVAFLSSRGGVPQIYVMPLDGGEPRAVTALPNGVGGGPVFSPDGSRLAFTAGPQGERRDPAKPYRVSRAIWQADGLGLLDDVVRDVYVVDVTGGEPQQLTQDRSLNSNPIWSADGKRLIFASSFDPDAPPMATFLRVADLDGTVTDVSHSGFLSSYAACPDGRIAYVQGFEFGTTPGTKGDLWVLDPDSGISERRAAGLDVGVGGIFQSDMLALMMTMGSLVISPDGEHAYTTVQRGGEGSIFRFALSGPEAYERVAGGQRVCAPVQLRGDTLLLASFGTTEPGDLYALDVVSGEERRLTELNAELLSELELPTAQRLSFTSSDGTSVEGWYLPPTAGDPPYPTVLGIHGGPNLGWGYVFNFDFLMLSGAGFGVLFVNHRGSTGYGDAFATATFADVGNLDYADVMAGVDHAIGLGLADGDRLGVFGMSAGGFLTGWILGHTGRFKAACPENPGFNWLSNYGTSDTGLWGGPAMLGGHPHEVPEVYQRCSPISYAHRCTTPTLFIQHEEDKRCPPEQTEQFYAIVKARGGTAEMLRLPGTSHLGSIIGPPSHRGAQNDALVEWMSRYLLDQSYETPG